MTTSSTPTDDHDFSIEELEHRFEMATLIFDPGTTSLSDEGSCPGPRNPYPDSACSGTRVTSLTTP